jgi:hypothetical protein
MTVRIVPESHSRERGGSDYLKVSTCSDPYDDTVTLATIQRFVEKQTPNSTVAPVHIKTLISRQPMSTDEALGLATCYAERKNIPVVYTD